MTKNVSLIGVQPEELPWLRLLISLLRHPDRGVGELTREALQYLAKTSAHTVPFTPKTEEIEDIREVL